MRRPARSKKNKNRDTYHRSVGVLLRTHRRRAKVSQHEMAELMGLETSQYVSNVERGLSPPSMEYLRLCISKFRLDEEELAYELFVRRLEYMKKELTKKAERKA